jgi:WD40 repeat protein
VVIRFFQKQGLGPAVAVSSDGSHCVSGSLDDSLIVWDLDSGTPIRTLKGHAASIVSVAISPDGQLILSGSRDTTLKVWALPSGQLLRTLEGHQRPVHCVAISPNSTLASSASDDHTLKVWDLRTGSLVSAFTCDDDARSCAFVDAATLLLGDARGNVHVLTLEQGSG